MKASTIIALLYGPDQPGLVSRVSSWIFLRGSNIHHADQHKDLEANIFFQRVEWTPSGQIDEEAADVGIERTRRHDPRRGGPDKDAEGHVGER